MKFVPQKYSKILPQFQYQCIKIRGADAYPVYSARYQVIEDSGSESRLRGFKSLISKLNKIQSGTILIHLYERDNETVAFFTDNEKLQIIGVLFSKSILHDNSLSRELIDFLKTYE